VLEYDATPAVSPFMLLRLGPALAAVLALAALGASAAGAAPATRETNPILFVGCAGTAPDGSRAAMEVSSGPFGLEADVRIFAPSAGEDEPPVVSSNPDISTGTVTLEGDSVTGSVPVFDTATGTPLGDATFGLTLTRGDPETHEGKLRNGNQLVRQSVTTFAVSGTGTLGFPGGPTLALSECAGVVGESTVFRNNPRAQITGSDVLQAFCDLMDSQGRRLLLMVDASGFSLVEFAPGADPEVDPPLLFGGAEDALFTRTVLTATAPLFAPADGDVVFVGDAIIQASVKAGSPTTVFTRAHRSRVRIRTWPLTFSGTIAMPDGRQYDMAGCTGHREVIQVQLVP
jgi:hypothetical protein